MSLRPRQAFTLIEMLVVIAIIAVLAALILTGAQALGIGSKREKTRTILAAVSKGINLTIASKGGSVSPVEHPLAGSRAPRFLFKRFTLPNDTVGSVNAGVTLDNSLTALSGLTNTNQLPSGASGSGPNDLMLASDLYADQASYLLFGMKREYIGILGAVQKRVTKYILLPKPLQGQVSLSATLYPTLTTAALQQYTIPTDNQDVDPTYGHPLANKQAIDYVFGSSNVQAELSGLNALHSADPTTAANATSTAGTGNNTSDNAFRNPINPMVISAPSGTPPTGLSADTTLLPMLYTDAKPVTTWQPGCINVSGGTADYTGTAAAQNFTLASGAGSSSGLWVHYRLPGLAIYDAWGVEVLYTISSQGGIRLMSAGADGVFQYGPGPNHVLDSSDPEAAPTGDDTNGAKDNIVQRVEEQQ